MSLYQCGENIMYINNMNVKLCCMISKISGIVDFFYIKSVNKKITIEKSIKRIKIGTFHYTTN